MKITKSQLRRIIREARHLQNPENRISRKYEKLVQRAAEIFAYIHEPSKYTSTSYPELDDLSGVYHDDDPDYMMNLQNDIYNRVVNMVDDVDDYELERFVRNI